MIEVKKMRNKAVILVALLVAFLCIASFSSVASAQQVYYVLGDEATSLRYAYNNMTYLGQANPMNGTVSIVAWEPVNVTLDKDEDGYGDIDDSTDLPRGGIWTLENTTLGGDIISANGSISVVRTAWKDYGANGPGTFAAGTWELFPIHVWGVEYVVPIGNTTTNGTSQLIVQAKANNTNVTVDGFTSVILNKGEDHHFKNVTVGTGVTANKSVQAGIITNQDGRWSLAEDNGTTPQREKQWDTRYFTLTPRSLLGNDYYVPVPSFEDMYSKLNTSGANDTAWANRTVTNVTTRLHIYAFNTTNVTIEDAGSIQYITIPAGEVNSSYVMPAISGVYKEEGDPAPNGSYAAHISGNDTIWVVGVCDDNYPDFDWGFQAINTSLLGNEYYIPWSPANPAYVTPIANNATFHVDLNVTDGNDEDYNFTLNRLNMSTIYPSSTNYTVASLNLTGARIWTNDNVSFAIQWGQDNNEDTPGERVEIPTLFDPDYDFGYTILPLLEFPTPFPSIGIEKLVDGVKSKQVVHNQTVTFTLNVTNTGNVTLKEILVNDTLPAKLTYINASPVQDSADQNLDGTTTIIWKDNLTELDPGNYIVITFNATIGPDAESGVTYTNRVTVNATSDYGDVGPENDSASVYLRRPTQVPVLSPFGIAALIGLLSLVAVLSISKGVRKKRG